ncbi:hypothetical protein MPTK1_2g24000 [Marchantia polymorpha subsp. ruderalis]|uniref:Uncharacterized protein n=1 Tax=Marchantia polymorpha TaxID=3197 RepID=A0A2R6WPE1_MARPO|nr:hypothetical protein MARPO_0069s0048 [Marchantia polymorpha]BBN03504.1 hypothetical protein Mp_2g24000 [Marchantia polymorpha subsp. ruderalis]|eukprot:PTQ35709.1 hypothetical protein MARPO_0069s0048 [Marchantia polymorpha]
MKRFSLCMGGIQYNATIHLRSITLRASKGCCHYKQEIKPHSLTCTGNSSKFGYVDRRYDSLQMRSFKVSTVMVNLLLNCGPLRLFCRSSGCSEGLKHKVRKDVSGSYWEGSLDSC